MNILLTGASGFIGHRLYIRLREQGHDVCAAVHNPVAFKNRFPDAKAIRVDYARDQHVSAWLPRLQGVDLVINAVGIISETPTQSFEDLHQNTPCALFAACSQAGVTKVVQISALGADPSAQSEYHRTKAATDLYLSGMELDWLILRPSIVYGPGAKSTAFFQALAALPFTPLLERGEQLIQPIHVNDLVRAVLLFTEQKAPTQAVVDLVGPDAISFRDYLQCWRRWLGLGSLRSVDVPLNLALCAAKLSGKINAGFITEQNLSMLAQGNTASVAGLRKQFDFTPQHLQKHLLQNPAQDADYCQATLYFMPHILLAAIALLWITTGLCSLGLYPTDASMAILAQAGIYGAAATVLLYAGGLLDLFLGLAMLRKQWLKPALYGQLVVTVVYTLIISYLLPNLWLHPFGPVTKNLPVMASTICLLVMTRR